MENPLSIEMNASMPDPNDPQPAPDDPGAEPARPPTPPEVPQTDEPPGIPPSSPDPVPSPGEEPIQIPPDVPAEVPSPPDSPAPGAARSSFLAMALACCIVASGPTVAQSQENGPDMTSPTDPCQARPDAQAGSDDEADGRADDAAPPELEKCNGVLTPPKTGDREIEEPPPDTGTTPVIPPENVPEQPPD